MEELRVAFLVIGGIAIVGILVHGLWSVRKNNEAKPTASLETADWQDQAPDQDYDEYDEYDGSEADENKREPRFSADDYDDLGLGAVRVVHASSTKDQNQSDGSQAKNDDISNIDNQFVSSADPSNKTQPDEVDLAQDDVNDAPKPDAPKPKIYSSVVTQPKPEYAAEQVNAMRSRFTGEVTATDDIPEPPPFLLKTDDKPEVNLSHELPKEHVDTAEKVASQAQDSDAEANKVEPTLELEQSNAQSEPPQANSEKVSLADQARNFVKRSKAESKPRKRREPKIREDQMRIDFDDIEPTSKVDETPEPKKTDAQVTSPVQQEVLVINVKAAEDRPIQGAALLPMLLTLGFKFGDQDIFHRHVNSNGKGPVLFSLANMFKPGVFDIDNLENFSTQGVSLFMMLPIEGDPHQVFNMMHNAARKIADEFSCQVLDGRRSALTKQSLQQYVEKIREFERQRMIAR